jgi:hypothetical protein
MATVNSAKMAQEGHERWTARPIGSDGRGLPMNIQYGNVGGFIANFQAGDDRSHNVKFSIKIWDVFGRVTQYPTT